MLGYYGQYSTEYLWTLMVLTTLFFALPLFLIPIQWGRMMQWEIPQETHLAIYFGRCLGALLLVIGCMALRALITGKGLSYIFDILFLVYIFMFFVHIYGALRRIQPITETLEIGFWVLLFVLNIVFYPAGHFVF